MDAITALFRIIFYCAVGRSLCIMLRVRLGIIRYFFRIVGIQISKNGRWFWMEEAGLALFCNAYIRGNYVWKITWLEHHDFRYSEQSLTTYRMSQSIMLIYLLIFLWSEILILSYGNTNFFTENYFNFITEN